MESNKCRPKVIESQLIHVGWFWLICYPAPKVENVKLSYFKTNN